MKADSLTSMLVLSMVLGCSSGQGGATLPGSGTGGSQGGDNGQDAGAVNGAGGSTGPSGSGGSTGGGGAVGDVAIVGGSDGSAGDGANGGQTGSGDGGPSKGPFTCSMVLGLFTTSQWFITGIKPWGSSKSFLQQPGIDPKKWEGKMQKASYVEKWADPNDALWNVTTMNPCAANATSPDRVVSVTLSSGAKDQPSWEALLTKLVDTIKMKYPGVKEIDLMTMARAPGNVLCPNNNDPNTVIKPFQDQAIQAVADRSNGLVVVGPKYEVPDCKTAWIIANDTDFTPSAADALAIKIAQYYAAHP